MKPGSGKHVDAAGGVLWRPGGPGGIEVALIHRPRYDDWSLPKGKIEPGETAIVAAVREIAEETGVTARLGRHLSEVTYLMPGNRVKRVDYWAAEAIGDTSRVFQPNNEVDRLEWVRAGSAAQLLSYPVDRDVIAEFQRLPANTQTILLVRHAKAGSREAYRGDDRRRPLDALGVVQAQALVPNLLAFGPRYVHSADPVRCVRTVAPLAEILGVDVVIEPAVSESAYAADPYAADDAIRKIAALGDVHAVCSQGKVMPGLLRGLANRDGMTLSKATNRKASFWVLSLHEGRFLTADYVESPLPADAGRY